MINLMDKYIFLSCINPNMKFLLYKYSHFGLVISIGFVTGGRHRPKFVEQPPRASELWGVLLFLKKR
jgi:hypothetical protein